MPLLQLLLSLSLSAALSAALLATLSARADILTLKQSAADLQKTVLCLDAFYTDCGHYPTTKEGLQALITRPKKGCKRWGNEPPKIPGEKIIRSQSYIQILPLDPWGASWHYSSTDGNSYLLISLGADGKNGGTGENADINSEEFLKKLPSGITLPSRCFDEN